MPVKPNHTDAPFHPIVGIDLGTTNSAVAFIRNGRPEIVPSSSGERIIPSVVLIDLSEKVIVGENARDALVAMPDRSIAAVKRRMGSTETLNLAGQALLPQEISAFILKELKTYVDDLFGEGEKEAVITVPAYFTDEQRRATKEAGELAGFVVERIINEPTAAALAYGLDHLKENKTFLVYDLGGGTFDVSVVEMMDGLLEVRATAGNRELGGEDFDWLLVDFFAETMIHNHGIDPRLDLRARALLKEEAERTKIELSELETVFVAIPLVTVQDAQPVGLHIEVTRKQFIHLIQDKLMETVDKVQEVLEAAALKPHEIDDILLVGGSSRIPRVQELMVNHFGKTPRADINPDEAVALGAAVQAGLKSGALSDSGLIATDVAPFSMGIAVLKEGPGMGGRPGAFAPIIERNTTIPVTRSQTFSTSVPGQTAVSIEIYQGEHEWVKHNHALGEFLLEGIPANREPESVQVTFRYNLNGILEVTAACVSTGEKMTVTVQDGLERNSQDAFRESMERLNSLWEGHDNVDDDLAEEDSMWEPLVQGELDLDELQDSNESPTVLNEEAELLKKRLGELLRTLEHIDKDKVQAAIISINEALASEDQEQLEDVLNEVTDFLIETEI
jgi:molecular chaperone DnaK